MYLIDGFNKFKNEVFPGLKNNFEELEKGQSPKTLFITCSDSRIAPNLITQTQPGELFVIRNAGNIVPLPETGELAIEATIQYAVEVLKVENIVVCGHSHCGAVNGLLNLDSLDELPAVKAWVTKSEQVLNQIGGEKDLNKAINANVALQLQNLMEYDYVSAAVDREELELHGWVYHFETGHIEIVNQELPTI